MPLTKQLQNLKKPPFHPIYLVLGEERQLQETVKQTFLHELLPLEEQDLNITLHSMSDVPIQVAIQDALSLPFFGDYRIVLVDQPSFLTGEKEKGKINHQLDELIEYIQSPLESTVMVFFAPYPKLDTRKKVVKELLKVATIIDTSLVDVNQIPVYLHRELQSYQLTMETHAEEVFLSRIHFSYSAMIHEMKKLALACEKGEIITLGMIEDLIPKSLEDNVFELSDLILNKKIKKALVVYQDLLKQKEDPVKMTSILIQQFRLLLQTAYLIQQGHSDAAIQKLLILHPYRLKIARSILKRHQMETLEEAYQWLIQTEIQLKSGTGSREFQLEWFILKFGS